MTEIRFYRSVGGYAFLSNLYCIPIVVKIDGEDVGFQSVEHAYQYKKTTNKKIAEYIRAAPFARLAAVVGHGLFPYDVDPDWNRIKVEWMRTCLEAKFWHKDMAEALLNTGDAVLLEASKTDNFWGIGKKGDGKNMLGLLLMQLRERLKEKRS
jgi:hypothetical protein